MTDTRIVTVRMNAASAAEYTQTDLLALLASKGMDTRTMVCERSDVTGELIYTGYRALPITVKE